MAIPSQRGTAVTAAVQTGNLVFTYPAGIVSGDVIVVSITQNGGSGGSITAPAGYSSKVRGNSGTTVGTETFARVADGTETGTVTFTLVTNQVADGAMTVWIGVDGTTPVEGSGSNTGGAGTNVVAPSATSTAANEELICSFGTRVAANGATISFATVSGMTELADNALVGTTAGISMGIGVQTLDIPTSGTVTGTKTTAATISPSGSLSGRCATTILLREGAVVAGPPIRYRQGMSQAVHRASFY